MRNKLLSLSAGAVLGFILVTGGAAATVCDGNTSTPALISDLLTVVLYSAAAFIILFSGIRKFGESAGVAPKSEKAKSVGDPSSFVKKFVGAFVIIYGAELFFTAMGIDLSCLTPSFPPELEVMNAGDGSDQGSFMILPAKEFMVLFLLSTLLGTTIEQ